MNKSNRSTATLPRGDFSRGPGKSLTKEQRDEERLERLTLAAFDLFTERGFSHTPIELLCSTANVSTRDFYKLGKNREALMAQVYQRVARFAETCVLQALASAPVDDWDARLDAAIDAWVHAYTHDERYARLSYLDSVGVSDELEQIRSEAHERFAALIRNEFHQRFPENDKVLAGKLPVAIIGACNELVRDWLGTRPRPSPEALTREIKLLYGVIIQGLEA
ncbi:TetR/AcrR family transcriptional regulator [Pseudohalioglobus sediminis]|uniref:TetR/AcrR family transcriptional regulator n=1 Tax=Pseudohalioglobus sediminis TaxID=2606449 RepID=A0A5B0X2X6_9GAMM|nr:TetR/AcrR family transcriptional regulator [Pseudohalioglobus sediminis]KAA1192509.1 TetR/AcrR family transcriptional regulator [Pseudohalioglobus sediminis]